MHLTFSYITGSGQQLSHNEDSLLLLEGVAFGERERAGTLASAELGSGALAVVDGMGGNLGGEVASKHVVDILARWRDWTGAGVTVALRKLNLELYELGSRRPELYSLGATIAGLAIGPDGLLAFNVGDARVYRLSGGFLQPLTKDDSLHQVLVDAGQADGQRAESEHSILQCLGGRVDFTEIEPHVHPVRLLCESRFIICSDGISDMLDADAMEAALRGRNTCEEGARGLYEAALAAGGKDNLSVIVADITPVK